MKSAQEQLIVKTGKPSQPESTPRLPHERDESDDSQESGVRPDILQAYKDLENGQVDTDLREGRGVDATVNKTPGVSPVNPQDVPAQKK